MSRLSNQRHKLIRSRHSNGFNDTSIREQLSRQQSEYELLAQFELRREKQKTKILEERLHNKEVFIHQMKQYQDQLTIAFEKCQQQLSVAKKQMELMSVVEREHLEEMAQLKHLIIRLQDEINKRDDEIKKRHVTSVKEEDVTPLKKRQVRSKTMMNEEEHSPKVLKNDIQAEVVNQSKKITKFLSQFLMMCQCFEPDIKKGSLKNRLKVGWKWVKEVVKEWNELMRDRQVIDDFVEKVKRYADMPMKTKKQEVFQRIMAILSQQ